MTHYTGYYFCLKSNIDGGVYHARNLVSLGFETEDFKNMIDRRLLENQDEFSWIKYNELRPEVFEWLEVNVQNSKDGTKGWCCGNKEYNTDSGEDFSLFFNRRKDAQSFIRQWSIHKKPTETYNQNTYIRRVLDAKTNTLKTVKKL